MAELEGGAISLDQKPGDNIDWDEGSRVAAYIPTDDPLERTDEEEINESRNVPSIYYGPLDIDGYERWDTEDLEISSPEPALINQ